MANVLTESLQHNKVNQTNLADQVEVILLL